MKRRELIKIFEAHGYMMKRPGANHDIYWNPETKRTIPIKRHVEIDDQTAKQLLKQAGIA